MKLVEIFTGGGGLAVGLHKAGLQCIGLYEWNHDSVETLLYNIKNSLRLTSESNVHEADVRQVDFSKYAKKTDILAGGPPCQPFSLGGLGAGNNDQRDMFPEAARALSEIQPSAFIFENVAGLLRPSFAPYFDYIIRSLKYPQFKRNDSNWEEHNALLQKMESEGITPLYNVTYALFNVADYGVPQNRKRVIIVGFKSELGMAWEPPMPTHSQNSLLYEKWVSHSYWKKHELKVPSCPLSENKIKAVIKKHEQEKLMPWKTVRDAIFGLPDPQVENNVLNHEYRGEARPYPGHSGSALDEPSKTIKAGAHGVPGGENTLVLDDGTLRYFTVRESARIQTFPDDYAFASSWGECMRQIGNAVPCKFAEIIGKSVIMQLRGAKNGQK